MALKWKFWQQQPSAPSVAQTENPKIQNALAVKLQNGLMDAFGFSPNPWSGLGAYGFSGVAGLGSAAEEVSDGAGLFQNLRWYLVSNFRQLMSQLYAEIGLIQTIVDIPVDDALRGGVTIKSKELDEDEIKELQNAMEHDGDLHILGMGAKWSRLFGGGGVIVIVDGQDPETPLEIETITPGVKVELKSADLWELFSTLQITSDMNPASVSADFEFYTYYGQKIHTSRILKMKGPEAPSFVRPRLRGWGLSVVETCVRSINQFLKGVDVTYDLLDEAKVDVYKIKNLVNSVMSPQGLQAIQNRVQLANYQKDYQNALVMDSEDDWDHKELSFSGVAESMAGIRKQVAADLRMPVTKLFGSSDSAGALGNADQNDMENYNSMIESTVRMYLRKHIVTLVELKCQVLFGFIPDDIEIEFKPLRVLSAVDEETVKTQKFARILQAKTAGELSTLEFRDACNKGNLFDIKLDTAEDSLNPDDPEVGDILSGKKQEEMKAAQQPAEGGGKEKSDKQPKKKEKGIKK